MACMPLQLYGPGSEQRQGGERTGLQSGAAGTRPKRPSTALAVTQSSIQYCSPPSAAGSAGSVAMKRKRAAADVAGQWRGQATANA